MKLIKYYCLLIVIGALLILMVAGCKNRKLAIQKDKTEIQEIVKENSRVLKEVDKKSEVRAAEAEKIIDKSGTWVWEEWYVKDTTISAIQQHGLSYKRTTFIKTDISTDRAKESTAVENHSERTDSSVNSNIVRQTVTESKKKDLEAKQSGIGWILSLVGIAVLFIIFKFTRK